MHLRTVVVVAFGIVTAAPPSAATSISIFGVWDTGSYGASVQIYSCGAALCGKVIDAIPLRTNADLRDERNRDPAQRGRRIMGLETLRGFTGGPPRWTGGSLYDPETGHSSSTAYLTLRADGRLEVKGCKARVFCQTKVWTKTR
jgi:uncharacterized protein (DUF2147 family)